MEDLTHPDKTLAALPEKPNFRKWRLRVATRERLGGRDCSEAAEADCPTKAGRVVVGSVEAEGLRTTPSLAIGVRPESSRAAVTLRHGRSPNLSEEREGTRTGPGRPRMTKRVLKDGLGIRDERAIKRQFRVEARRIASNAKQ